MPSMTQLRRVVIMAMIIFCGVTATRAVDDVELPTAFDEYSFYQEGDIVWKKARIAVTDNDSLWPGGRMPVNITFEANNINDIIVHGHVIEAIKIINKVSGCVQLVQATYEDVDVVHIRMDKTMYSSVGRHGGAQWLGVSEISSKSNPGSIAHEFLHALGFGHEHNRPARDEYITIHWDNIKEVARPYYKKYNTTHGFYTADSLPYDYDSLLHGMGWNKASAIDVTKPVITRKDGGTAVGQRSYLTDLDVRRIQDRYQCGVCTRSDSNYVLFNYPGDCEKFIQCSNGYQYVMPCAVGLHFSYGLQRCDYPEIAGCTYN